MSKNAKRELKAWHEKQDAIRLEEAQDTLILMIKTVIEDLGIRVVSTAKESAPFNGTHLLFHPHISDLFAHGDIDKVIARLEEEFGEVDYDPDVNAFLVRW